MGLGEGEGDAGMSGERGNCDHDGLYERRPYFNKNKKNHNLSTVQLLKVFHIDHDKCHFQMSRCRT